MNGNELMIGDLVTKIGYPNFPLHVSQIRGGNIRYRESFGGNMMWIQESEDRMSNVEPIELTEEILAENFNKGTDYTGSRTYYKNLDPESSSDYFGVSVYPDGFFLEVVRPLKHGLMKKFVKYVHELQHALRLCDMDEIADNITIPGYYEWLNEK